MLVKSEAREVMKLNTTNRNIVLKKSEFVPGVVAPDEIKDVILSYFSNISSPLVNQYPDFLVYILPEKQFTLTVQKESIIVADNPQINNGNLEELIKIATDLDTKFNQYSTQAFGINYMFLVEEVNLEKVSQTLDMGRLSENDVITGSTDITKFGFTEKISEDTRRLFSFDFLLNSEGSPSTSMKVKSNLHNKADTLPTFAELKEKIQSEETSIKSIIETICG